MVRAVLLLAFATLVSGCATLATWPTVTPEEECARVGGLWRPALAYCEVASGITGM